MCKRKQRSRLWAKRCQHPRLHELFAQSNCRCLPLRPPRPFRCDQGYAYLVFFCCNMTLIHILLRRCLHRHLYLCSSYHLRPQCLAKIRLRKRLPFPRLLHSRPHRLCQPLSDLEILHCGFRPWVARRPSGEQAGQEVHCIVCPHCLPSIHTLVRIIAIRASPSQVDRFVTIT